MDTSEAITISYTDGKDFEILVDPDLAKEAKMEGKDHDIQRLLFVQDVFTDAGAGERASVEELQSEFNTDKMMEAAEQVFEKGSMQLTTEQKADIRDDKWKQLVDMIARRAQNPQTGNPHPPNRVENALEEAGFHIDWDADLEEAFDEATDLLKPIIPISLQEKDVAIRIPVDKTGKAYDRLQQVADVREEQWGSDFFTARVSLPAGVLTDLMEDLQEYTGGEAEMKEY